MRRFVSGYKKFKESVFPVERDHFKLLESGQTPHTLFITCSDSRVLPNMITQTEPGELFICRVVGNLVPAHGTNAGGVTSAVEYAVRALKVQKIVVCGHSDCGAMKAFLHPDDLKEFPAVSSWLHHADAAVAVSRHVHGHLPEGEFIQELIKENVVCQVNNLKTHPSVATALRLGKLKVFGWVYDIGTGTVFNYEEREGTFVRLEDLTEQQIDEETI